MTKVLGLTAKDLEVSDDELCTFFGNTNCPPPPPVVPFVVMPPSTPATSQIPVVGSTLTTASTVNKPLTAVIVPGSAFTTAATTPSPAVIIPGSSFATAVPTLAPANLLLGTLPPVLVPAPALVVDMDSFDGIVPIFDLKATDKLPDRLTCQGILAAGTAASALTAKDLESWSSKQLLNCLEVLGSIEASRETKKDIWNLIKNNMVRYYLSHSRIALQGVRLTSF